MGYTIKENLFAIKNQVVDPLTVDAIGIANGDGWKDFSLSGIHSQPNVGHCVVFKVPRDAIDATVKGQAQTSHEKQEPKDFRGLVS